MPIRLKHPPEPFTGQSLDSDTLAAESDAYRRLCRDVHRYASGAIAGRSFLVSGHRGAGKTFTVYKAIEDTRKLCEREGAPLPFLVKLFGPDLLPAATHARPRPPDNTTLKVIVQGLPKASPADDNPAQDSPNDSRKVPQDVLTEVTRATYQAILREMYLAYRNRALSEGSRPDALQLAAQLRVALDDAPELPILVGFWRRLDCLHCGLFGPFKQPKPNYESSRDQGMLEVIALSAAAEAYRRVIGKTVEQQTNQSAATARRSVAIQTALDLRKSLSPLIGVAAGLGVGLSIGNGKGAVAGTVIALGTTLALGYSSSRERESVRKRDITFLPDTSVTALVRTLPNLVGLLRQAGLAPVFVVDELDKVDDLEDKMPFLVDYLKQFVTENALFCFITDRSYSEHLRNRG